MPETFAIVVVAAEEVAVEEAVVYAAADVAVEAGASAAAEGAIAEGGAAAFADGAVDAGLATGFEDAASAGVIGAGDAAGSGGFSATDFATSAMDGNSLDSAASGTFDPGNGTGFDAGSGDGGPGLESQFSGQQPTAAQGSGIDATTPSQTLEGPQANGNAFENSGGFNEGGNGLQNNPTQTVDGYQNTSQSPFDSLKDMYKNVNDYLKPVGGVSGLSSGAQTLYGMYQKNAMAKNQQRPLNELNSMYQPGSPEAMQMQKELEARDSARGRNSQYGSRQVELGAALAKNRSQILTSPGYAQYNAAAGYNNATMLNGLFTGDKK